MHSLLLELRTRCSCPSKSWSRRINVSSMLTLRCEFLTARPITHYKSALPKMTCNLQAFRT